MFEGNNSGVFIVNFEHVIADWETCFSDAYV